jgi:transposase-like protein
MRQHNKQAPQSAEETVRDIRRATRRHFSAEEKIRIVLEGLRGEDSIAELCRKEGVHISGARPPQNVTPRDPTEAAARREKSQPTRCNTPVLCRWFSDRPEGCGRGVTFSI